MPIPRRTVLRLSCALLAAAGSARAEGALSFEAGLAHEGGAVRAGAALSFAYEGSVLGWDWSSTLSFDAEGGKGALELRRDLGGRAHVLSLGHLAFGGHALLLPEAGRVSVRYAVEGEQATIAAFLADPSRGADATGGGPLGDLSAALAAEWWRTGLLSTPFPFPGEPTVSTGWDLSAGLEGSSPTLGWALGAAIGRERWGAEETRWRSAEFVLTGTPGEGAAWSLGLSRTWTDDPWTGPIRDTGLSAAFERDWGDAGLTVGLDAWRSSLDAAEVTLRAEGTLRLSDGAVLGLDAEIGRSAAGGPTEPIRLIGLSLRLDAPFPS